MHRLKTMVSYTIWKWLESWCGQRKQFLGFWDAKAAQVPINMIYNFNPKIWTFTIQTCNYLCPTNSSTWQRSALAIGFKLINTLFFFFGGGLGCVCALFDDRPPGMGRFRFWDATLLPSSSRVACGGFDTHRTEDDPMQCLGPFGWYQGRWCLARQLFQAPYLEEKKSWKVGKNCILFFLGTTNSWFPCCFFV